MGLTESKNPLPLQERVRVTAEGKSPQVAVNGAALLGAMTICEAATIALAAIGHARWIPAVRDMMHLRLWR